MKRKKFSFGKDNNAGGGKKVRSIELDDDSPPTTSQGVGTPSKAEAPKSGGIAAFFARKTAAPSATPPTPQIAVVDVDEPEIKAPAQTVAQSKPPQPDPAMFGITSASLQSAPASQQTSSSVAASTSPAPTAVSKEPESKMLPNDRAAALQKPAVAPPSAPAASLGRLTLQGMVFVFTGELEGMQRAEAEEAVKVAGGKVTGSVSGNTTYVVVGSRLEDGRPVEETGKYRKYLEIKEKFDKGQAKKCPTVLTEEELMKMLPGEQPPPAATNPVVMTPTVGSSSSSTTSQVQPVRASPSLPLASRPDSAEGRDITGTLQDPNVGQLPWVDLHAPKDFSELVGNQSQVKKLTQWLNDWENVVLKGQTKKVAFKVGGGFSENVNARAALISGPPGIGKTTTCRLIAAMNPKYELLEFNASDSRGQKIIQSMADGVADNRTINFARKGSTEPPPTKTEITKKALIIMDEVDGMAGGDRGGNAALIKMIKKTRNPIICICNDSQSQKMRSLSYSCYDLKFIRPQKSAIAQRAVKIAQSHGIPVEPNAAEMLAESCGNDIRMIINQLQAMAYSERCRQDQGITYSTAKEKMDGCKDVQVMLSHSTLVRRS
jgi:replication factor C subunit 1